MEQTRYKGSMLDWQAQKSDLTRSKSSKNKNIFLIKTKCFQREKACSAYVDNAGLHFFLHIPNSKTDIHFFQGLIASYADVLMAGHSRAHQRTSAEEFTVWLNFEEQSKNCKSILFLLRSFLRLSGTQNVCASKQSKLPHMLAAIVKNKGWNLRNFKNILRINRRPRFWKEYNFVC